MYSQVNEEGHMYQFMSVIVDHKADSTVIFKPNGMEISRNGYKTMKKTTLGWWFMLL